MNYVGVNLHKEWGRSIWEAGSSPTLLYRPAVASGLRRGEIQSITASSLDWTSKPSNLIVAAIVHSF